MPCDSSIQIFFSTIVPPGYSRTVFWWMFLQKFVAMKFTQIMGTIYLSLFIGFILYQFNFFASGMEESFLLGVVFVIILLILALIVRKILTN